MLFTRTSAVLALAGSAFAHIIMESPAPFQWEDSATQQSPLEPADFPCKQPSGKYIATDTNNWKAGESKGVKLIGGATHGGGSCQFSLTTDQKPTKDSQWKVIHSVIGQCPGGPSDNNLSGDKNDQGNAPINVTLPQDLPSGQYTFAWSWLNKIGNREFYMNCAPLNVEGSSSKSAEDVLGQLPDMFVINLPATSCESTPYQDFQFPNPGDSVATGAQATPGAKTTGAGCASMAKMGAGAGKLGSPAEATGAPAVTGQPTQPAATSAAAVPSSADAAPSNPGGVFAPGASSAPSATQPAATSLPGGVFAPGASSAPAASQPAAQPSGISSPVGTGTPSTGECTACDTDGAVVCIGTNQFGLCNRGCAVAQDLAAGMACANGLITRSIRFPRGHLHRRHGSERI